MPMRIIDAGPKGDHGCPGIRAGDQLEAVLHFAGAGLAITDVAEVSAEFCVARHDAITNGDHDDGIDRTGKYLVVWRPSWPGTARLR